MKKVLLSFFAAAMVCTAFGQDVNQAKGTWYLGSADATELLGIFSDGVNVSPFVGYAIADNIAITLGINYGSLTNDGVDGGNDYTASTSTIDLGAAYFFGDNFYGQVGVSIGSGSVTNLDATTGLPTDTSTESSSTGVGFAVGKFIPVKDMWYISPSIGYQTGTTDNGSGGTGSGAGANIGITFGARF
jgi:hypothetical protein